MYKYGIISTASITSRFIDGLRKAQDEVICIGSRDISKAKDFAIKNNIKEYYGTYEEVYENPEVDIVYIPLINNLHYEYASKALEHKKHVILEKPFTLTSLEAKSLFEIAKRNNCFLFEAVKNVFVPSTKFIIDNLSKIGKVNKIITNQGIKNPFPKEHWMYDVSKGGGSLYGSYSYVFHYLRYIFKKEITNLDGTFIPSSKSDLISNFNFNLEDIQVNSTIDMSKDLDNKCIIYGTNGKIIVDEFWRSHHVVVELDNNEKFEFKDEGNEFVYEVLHIQECLNNSLLQSPYIKDVDSIKEIEDIEYLYKKWKLIK